MVRPQPDGSVPWGNALKNSSDAPAIAQRLAYVAARARHAWPDETHNRRPAVLSGHVDDLKMRELVATIDALRLQARPDQRTAAVPTGLAR